MFVNVTESLMLACIPKMNRCGTPKNNVYGIAMSKIGTFERKRMYEWLFRQ